ncbi:unnamed protein product [Scytosiphon promiscuus]
MFTAPEMSISSPLGTGYRDSHAEPVSVEARKIELQPSMSILVDRGLRRADVNASPSGMEAAHLQERCVDMAMELFELKTRFDEKEKELKWFKREADSRERDFKEVQRVCEEERRSSKSFMRRVSTLEEENRQARHLYSAETRTRPTFSAKLAEDNADLRLDRDRLLGVVRRHKEAGRSDSVAAHRDRIRKRNMSQKEVNRCDLATAKLELKAMGQENNRLLSKVRGQANRVRQLEEEGEVLAKKVSGLEAAMENIKQEKADVQRTSDKAMASEERAKSDMEHEALLRLQANERAAAAERAEREAREARASAELLAESLRIQLTEAAEQLEAKHSARARHQGSVARYQKMIDAQGMALQAAREQLLGEKVRRQESERQARLRHIAAIDSRSRASGAPGCAGASGTKGSPSTAKRAATAAVRRSASARAVSGKRTAVAAVRTGRG